MDDKAPEAKPLQGKKIGVVVENIYIKDEIDAYQEFFGNQLGAQVDLMTHLWDSKAVYYSDEISDLGTDRQGRPYPSVDLSHLDVRTDFDRVDLSGYAAVLMAANYTSVRLRYFQGAENGALPSSSPAVQFFAKAMRTPTLVKGALCHGLWILTPMPELLRGRRVICHEVVQADVENAGAVIQRSPSNVVIDGDLVTGHSKKEAVETEPDSGLPPYIRAICDQILVYSGSSTIQPAPAPAWEPSNLPTGGEGKRRVLVVLSEWGYWGEELVGPLDVFHAASYHVEFATANGKRPPALRTSTDPTFVDPPLGRPVVSEKMAKMTQTIDGKAAPTDGKRGHERSEWPWLVEWSHRLDLPHSLAAKLPELPYWSAPNYLRRMEEYYRNRAVAWDDFITPFDALLIVGGSGPMVDMANNQRVHDLILGFLAQDKPVAAECYGVTCLAFARNLEDRKSIIWGKHVTGHCREYDYKDGTGFEGAHAVDGSNKGFGDGYINFGPPFYPLEYILRDATGPDGGYHGNFGHDTSVIVDYPFITGRSTPDAYLTGQKLVEVLDANVKKYGW
jgi:putative intracellular protease/amidase